MAEVHQLILQQGIEEARRRIDAYSCRPGEGESAAVSVEAAAGRKGQL